MAAPKAIQTPRHGQFDLTVANTAYDGTGTWVTIMAGVAGGSVLQWMDLAAIVATTEGNVKFAMHDGSNTQYFGKVRVDGRIAPGATNPGWEYHGPPPGGPRELSSASMTLKAAPEKAEAINGLFYGGDFV